MRKLADEQPHVVIVDGCSAAVDPASTIALSRGLRDYASWFAAFNERRRPGEPDSSWGGGPLLGQEERSEWDGFVEASWLLEEWGVGRGQRYSLDVWAPEARPNTRLGDAVCATPAAADPALPTVILANPIVYRTSGADLHPAFVGTTPRYFDDPEQQLPSIDVGGSGRTVAASTAFGFGAHGLRSVLVEPTVEMLVARVQRRVQAIVAAELGEAT